jgi:hypothetical protein
MTQAPCRVAQAPIAVYWAGPRAFTFAHYPQLNRRRCVL